MRSHSFWRSVLNEKNMASQVEDIERIFEDISNYSRNIKSLEFCNGVDGNHELQLQKHKNHLASLKTMLIRLQTQSCFLENVAKENWSSPESIEMTEHQANARDENKKDKQMIEEVEKEIEDLAETLCTKHKVLTEKLELLEQKIAVTTDKKNKYEMMKEKSAEFVAKVQEKGNEEASFDEVKAKELEADLAIQQCKAAISSLEHCKGLLQAEVSHLEECVNEVQDELKIQTAINQYCDEHEQKKREWLASAVQLYANLGGVNVQSVEGDSVVLEIPNDTKPAGDQATDIADAPLILNIKFRLEGGIRPVFAGAKVSLDSLNIDDLVSEAVNNEDVVAFVLQVKRRFRNQRGLIREVEELKTNYAMDWEPSHGRIRVMLGRSGKIVCTLKVDPMYSAGQGTVQLLRVEGSIDETGIQNLQCGEPGRSLTACIKDLQEFFSNQ